MNKLNTDYDLIIIGAGLVGATLACAVAEKGLRVAMVEANVADSDWPENTVDTRVFAITRASEQIFASLDVWPRIKELGVSAYRDMHVWDASSDGVIHFDSAEVGEAYLGHIIENRVIQRSLLEKIDAMDAVTLISPACIESMSVAADKVSVSLDNHQTITAFLLIGADGAQSGVRTLANIEVDGASYGQSAVVAHVGTSQSNQETAWQRFMPDGPLAFLPLADGSSSIVWTTSPEHADELLAMEEADFLDALQQTYGDTLGRMLACDSRATFPLKHQHAKQYTQPRIALVGDAAHTVHPLAGQGVNLGLADAATLAEVLLEARSAKRDIGAHKVLRRYERWRKGDNATMLSAMSGFKSLFGDEKPTVRWLRNTGLSLINRTTPIKNQIMRQAMGLEGDLSRLAQGKPL